MVTTDYLVLILLYDDYHWPLGRHYLHRPLPQAGVDDVYRILTGNELPHAVGGKHHEPVVSLVWTRPFLSQTRRRIDRLIYILQQMVKTRSCCCFLFESCWTPAITVSSVYIYIYHIISILSIYIIYYIYVLFHSTSPVVIMFFAAHRCRAEQASLCFSPHGSPCNGWRTSQTHGLTAGQPLLAMIYTAVMAGWVGRAGLRRASASNHRDESPRARTPKGANAYTAH